MNRKMAILKFVRKNPDVRLRSIGRGLNVWHLELYKDVAALVEAGMLIVTEHHDPANMEHYNTYRVRNRG